MKKKDFSKKISNINRFNSNIIRSDTPVNKIRKSKVIHMITENNLNSL